MSMTTVYVGDGGGDGGKWMDELRADCCRRTRLPLAAAAGVGFSIRYSLWLGCATERERGEKFVDEIGGCWS